VLSVTYATVLLYEDMKARDLAYAGWGR